MFCEFIVTTHYKALVLLSDEIRAYKSITMLPLISYSIRRYKQQSLHQTFLFISVRNPIF